MRCRCCAFLAIGLSAAGAAQNAPLRLEKTLPLDGVEGRIDHLSVDLTGNRLFVAALGNHTVEVLGLAAGARVKSIDGLAEPQGVFYHPETNRLFVASRADGTVKVFDAASFHLLAATRYSGDADNLRYDPATRLLIVGYGDGALGWLDLDGKKAGEVELGAHPESFQLEPSGSRIFVNLPDSKSVAAVDRRKREVTARWRETRALKNYPMSLDAAHHRLFLGCRAPARLLVLDTESGKTVAEAPATGDSDDLFYDPARRCVYVIGGEGFVEVFRQIDPDRYETAGRTKTAPGARTGLLVPELGRLFVAVPHRGAQKAAVLVYSLLLPKQ